MNRISRYFESAWSRIAKYLIFLIASAVVVVAWGSAVGWAAFWTHGGKFVAVFLLLAVVTILFHEAAITLGITPESPAKQQAAVQALQQVAPKQQEAAQALQDAVPKQQEAVQALQEAASKQQEVAQVLQQAASKQQEVAQALQQIGAQQTAVQLLQQAGPKQQEAVQALQQAASKQQEAVQALQQAASQQAGPQRPYPPGLWGIIVGKDWRWSTSKCMFALWTYILLFALIALIFFYPEGFKKLLSGGAGLGYLILIGSPAAAAVLAKASTSAGVTNGDVIKSPFGSGTPMAPLGPTTGTSGTGGAGTVTVSSGSGLGTVSSATISGPSYLTGPPNVTGAFSSGAISAPSLPTPATGLTQLYSDDDGDTDLADFQYLCFNLVLLAYFLYVFLFNPENGLPDLPDVLLALAGVAATGYASNKYFQSNPPPTINSADPKRIVLGQDPALDIAGANFGEEDPLSMPQLCHVMLNGRPLTYDRRRIVNWHDQWIRVALPRISLPNEPPEVAEAMMRELQHIVPAGSAGDSNVELVVYDRYGRPSQQPSQQPYTVVVNAAALPPPAPLPPPPPPP
jgi:hypothetical protein